MDLDCCNFHRTGGDPTDVCGRVPACPEYPALDAPPPPMLRARPAAPSVTAPRTVAVVATLGEWHKTDDGQHAGADWNTPIAVMLAGEVYALGAGFRWNAYPIGQDLVSGDADSIDDGIAQAERALLGDAASQAPGRPSGATPADAPSLAALSDAVRARLGRREDGARCEVSADLFGGDTACRVVWRRVYNDPEGPQTGDPRMDLAPDPIAALRAVLAYEDAADAREPEHAGPPPR